MATRSGSLSLEKPLPTEGKKLAQEIFLKTMTAIDVRHAMLSKIKREGGNLVAAGLSVPLARPPRVLAFGKAANRMAAVLTEILGGEVEAGVVASPVEPVARAQRFRYFVGGHPYPTRGSVEGAEAALELVTGLAEDDLVIFLISGGGSAILEKPLDPAVSLADLVEFNRLLVTGGLPIGLMNTLRKHVSAVKGGRLAARAYPARQFTIYVSDVPERQPTMVASGPTMPDESTVAQCYGIAEEHGLTAKFPAALRRPFADHALEETPKAGNECFRNSSYFCLLSNRDAVEGAKAAAGKLGFTCEIDDGGGDADYREVARANLASLEALAQEHPGEALCLVVGGEVNCLVTGPGMGGRNQAFVLYAAQLIAGQKQVVLSAGTDGRDGNSPASGAVADGRTVARARALGLDPEKFLAESDSYHFFCALGDTVETGFTDNNIRDVRLWLGFS